MPLSQELQDLRDDTLNFLRTHWIAPSSGYTMASGGPLPYLPLHSVFIGNKAQIDSLVTVSGNRDKVAFAKLIHDEGNRYSLAFNSHKQLNVGDQGNFLPIWFLPWWSDHVTKLKILNRGLLPPNMPDPDIFVTSALSGCSVFVEGPANAPTVYHGGFSNTRDFTTNPRVQNPQTGQEADSVEHWRLLFANYGQGVGQSEVNKTHYLSGGGNYQAFTPDMQAYHQFIKSSTQTQLRIQDMKSEGTVFGIRDDAGNWSFYLQESVTVELFLLRRQKRFLRKERMVDGERRVFKRPMCIKQIYPGGANAITWNLTQVLP